MTGTRQVQGGRMIEAHRVVTRRSQEDTEVGAREAGRVCILRWGKERACAELTQGGVGLYGCRLGAQDVYVETVESRGRV